MALSARREFRQHSKSTLVRAANSLFQERETLLAIERRRWLRRLVAVGLSAFAAGAAVGALAIR